MRADSREGVETARMGSTERVPSVYKPSTSERVGEESQLRIKAVGGDLAGVVELVSEPSREVVEAVHFAFPNCF